MIRRLASPEELAEGSRQIRESEDRLRREGIEVVEPGRGHYRSPEEGRDPIQEFLISPTATPQALGPAAAARELRDGATVSPDGDGQKMSSEVGSREGKARKSGAQEEGSRLEEGGSRVGGDPEPSSSMIPLFNEDQLKRMDQMYSQAPLLQRQEPAVERPVWMQAEDERLMRMREEREREREEVTRAAMLREYPPGQIFSKIHALEKQNEEAKKANEEIRRANEELRRERAALVR